MVLAACCISSASPHPVPAQVIGFDAKAGLYKIKYDDGDEEEMSYGEVLENLSSGERAKPVTAAQKKNLAGASVGDRVVALYQGDTQNAWFLGKVTAKHADGTYDIAYDDGDTDEHLAGRYVRRDIGTFAVIPDELQGDGGGDGDDGDDDGDDGDDDGGGGEDDMLAAAASAAAAAAQEPAAKRQRVDNNGPEIC